MKILLIHQYYLMPGMPGGSRFNEFARLWSDAGHEVTVIAGTVDYSTGTVPERYRGRWWVVEEDGPVRVIRCYVPGSYGKGYLGRSWAFLGFALSAASALLRVERPDVVIATSPPLVVLIPGWLISRVKRTPWVFEVRDLWPESAVTTGVLKEGAPITRLLYMLERWGYRAADRINVLTPAFRDGILKRGLAPAEKIVFVPNGADVELFQPGPRDNNVRRQHGWGDRFVVMYTGAHGRANAVSQLVGAAERLKHRPEVFIASVGDGPERKILEQDAIGRGLQNIRFYGAQPKPSMPDWVNAADVGAAVLQNNPTFRTVYPNKVFDYMACERPVLLAIDGVARKLVCDEAQAGIFVEPENPDALADAIAKLSENREARARMGSMGREWVLAHATRDALAQRYLSVMHELAS